VTAEGLVFGWSYDPNVPYWANDVKLYFDGPAESGLSPILVTAGDWRHDIGAHAFSYPLPAQYRDGKQHTVYAYRTTGASANQPGRTGAPPTTGRDPTGASDTLLAGSPLYFTFGTSAIPGTSTPPPPDNVTPQDTISDAQNGVAGQAPGGRLDSISTAGIVYGWSYDPDQAYWQNNVELYFDGPAGSGVAPVTIKADAKDRHAGLHGFRYLIPDQYRNAVAHTVYAYGLDLNDATGGSRTLLAGSPKSFTLGIAPTPTPVPSPTPTPAVPPTSTPTGSLCSIAPADGQDAIAAAIRACPNGSTVLFPSNQTYHQTDKIMVTGRKNLTIDGNGSTFVKTSPSASGAVKPNWWLENDTSLVIKNMTVRGSFIPPSTRGIIPGNQYEHGFTVASGVGITIQDVAVFRVYGEFVTVQPSCAPTSCSIQDPPARNVRVLRLVGDYAARQCIAPISVVGFWLEDSKLSNCWQHGVDAEIDYPEEILQDLHFLRNEVSNHWGSAFAVPVKGNPGNVRNIEIRNNRVLTAPDVCLPAIWVTYPDNNVGNASMLQGIVVADNQLKTIYEGVKLQDVASGSVTGNRIEITVSPNLCGPPRGQPVVLVNSPNVVVSGNTGVGY
jgi:hypothetical protein